MKLIYEINPQSSVEVECPTVQEVIEKLNYLRDSVGYEPCGQCKNDYTILRHRNVGGNDFYEHVCMNPDCRAVLALGQNKEEKTLYKKRMETNSKGKAEKNDDGKAKYLAHNGWGKYNPTTKEVEY